MLRASGELRVLWLTHVMPSPVRRKLGLPELRSGGWVDALRAAMVKHQGSIRIAVLVSCSTPFEAFEEDLCAFFWIPRSVSGFGLKSVVKSLFRSVRRARETSNFSDALATFDPDLIHVHGSEGALSFVNEAEGITIILSIQGIVSVTREYAFVGLRGRDLLRYLMDSSPVTGRGPGFSYLRLRIRAKDEIRTFRRCMFFIGRTGWDRAVQRVLNPQAEYFHCEELLRIPFRDALWKGPSSSPTIFCISSGDSRKGLLLLLDSLSLLPALGRKGITLRVAGPIKGSPLWPIVRNRVQRNHLDDQVQFLGGIGPEEVAAEMVKASVFVQPSYIENSSNSVCEAMAVGVPVIAAHVGGIPSLLTHGSEGLLFSPGDRFSLAEMISRVFADPELATELARRARAIAGERHDPESAAAKLASIYSEVIAKAHDQHR